MASNATSSNPQPGMASMSKQATPQAGSASTVTTQAAQPVLMSDYSRFMVSTGNLEIPEYCFMKSANLALRDNKTTRRDKPEEAKESKDIVTKVGVILSALMNTSGGVLHIHHVTSDNRAIDEWLQTLNSKLAYIPESVFNECLSLQILGGQDVFIYVRRSKTLVVRTHMYCRSPVGAVSEAEFSSARSSIVNRKRTHHQPTKTFSHTLSSYDSVLPPEGIHRVYKHYRQVPDVTELIERISRCFEDIFSFTNSRGGGHFVIGVDNETLKVKGIQLTEIQKVSFKQWLDNWLKESDGQKRVWGNVSHEPEEGKDYTLEYIPVANHPDGSDYYLCVLTMSQCLGGVYTDNPEFYTVDLSGEISRRPHPGLMALLTPSSAQNQPVEQIVAAMETIPASSSSVSRAQSGNNPTNQQTSSQGQTSLSTHLPLSSGALWSKCVEWESHVVRVESADTQPRALLELTNPLNIVDERHIIELIKGSSLEDFCNSLCSEFAQENGFAFLGARLGGCMQDYIQSPVDHVFDVVVFLENFRLCLISCFKNPDDDSNRRARCQYVLHLARMLKYGILSMIATGDRIYDVKVETRISSCSQWSDAVQRGKLQDFYNANIYTDVVDESLLRYNIEVCISSNMLWIKGRLGEIKPYRLTEQQIDAKKSVLENKLSLVEAPPGCGKSIMGAYLCCLYGEPHAILYADPGKGFLTLIKYQGIADVVHVTKDEDIDKLLDLLDKGRFEMLLVDDVQAMKCTPSSWSKLLERAYPKLKKIVFLCDSQFQDHNDHNTVQSLRTELDKFTEDRYPSVSRVTLNKNMRNTEIVFSFLAVQIGSLEVGHRCGSNLRGDDVAFEVVEQALEDSSNNKLLQLLERTIRSTGDHRYTERDIMLLLCDGDDEQAQMLRDIINRHSNYKPCRAEDVPHEGVVVDVLNSAIGMEASVCIVVWLKDTSNTDNAKFRVFAASRGVMRVTLVFPRHFTPEEATELGLQDLTSVTDQM